MTYQQLYDLAHRKSYFSRSDAEVWAALSGAALALYQKVLAEHRGFFVVYDTSTVALVPQQEEYALPGACTQLLRVREQTSSSAPWRVVMPAENFADEDFTNSQYYSLLGINMDGPVSEFEYLSYLTMADAETTAQVERIRFEPPPYDTRNVELVYVARFIEITGPQSQKFMPVESDQCVLYGAVARLLGDNGDDPSIAQAQAKEQEIWFLEWVRRRQFQSQITHVVPFIDDMD